MSSIASLIVKIGANDAEIQKALASVGEKAKSLNADLSKLGNSPLAGTAQKSLENLRATMDTITKAQQDIANRASLAAQGLEAIGGAGKLTDSQLKAVNKTLQDGLSAFRALGQEAPDQLKQVADAVESAAKPMDSLNTKIIAIGSLVGNLLANAIAGTVTTLIEAGKETFRYADQLENLSAATGISVEGLQRLENIGVTAGVTTETLANAVEQLQKHLDDPAAINAIERMGLNYAHIRELSPEQQFLAIAQAVAGIQDRVVQANTGAELFAKTWSSIAPAIKGDVEKAANSVQTLSAEEVDALDALGDAWDRVWLKAKRYFADVVAASIPKGPSPFITSALAGGILDPSLVPVAPQAPASPFTFAPGTRQAIDPAAIATLEIGGKTLEQQKASAIELAKIVDLQKQLFGTAVIEHANELAKALGSTDNLSKLTDKSLKTLHDDIGAAFDVYRARAEKIPPVLQRIYEQTFRIRNISNGLGLPPGAIPTTTGLDASVLDFSTDLGSNAVARFANGNEQNLGAQHIFGPANVGIAAAQNIAAIQGASTSFADTFAASVPAAIQAAIQGGGSKLQAAGSAIGSALFAKDAGLGKAISGIFSADGVLGKTLASAVPVIGALVGPALEGLGKLWGKIFGTAGRDAVRDFATKNGGFDALHQELGQLGADGEKLWVTLTQGVGRNNADQAKAAIQQVTAALDAQHQKITKLQTDLGSLGTRLASITTLSPALKSALDHAMDATSADQLVAALTDINSAIDEQQAKFKKISDTLSKYGLAVSEAGTAFKQESLNQAAQTLIEDFTTLKDAGVDVNHEMHAMGDNIRQFIKDAKTAGLEVPESMKQVIQSAIDAGEVFDENGNKITSMSQLGLTFGTTMQTVMTQTIPNALARLNAILEGFANFFKITLPQAAESGAAGIQDAIDGITGKDVTVQVHSAFDPNAPDVGGFTGQVAPDGGATGAFVQPWGLQHFARGGFARGTDTIPAMVSPGELIMTVAQQKNVASALNGGDAALIREVQALRLDVQALQGALRFEVDGRSLNRALVNIWDNSGDARTTAQQSLGVRR